MSTAPASTNEPSGTGLLLRSGRIWRGRGLGFAEAVLVRDGGIAWVGRDRDVPDVTGRHEVIDLRGRLVTPGIVDAHNHVRLGTGTDAVQLSGATSMPEVHQRINDWLRDNPSATWVHAEGFDYSALPEARHPRLSDLDGVGNGRPIMILDYSVHAALLNQAALDAFGIGAGSGDVAWGTVERDDDGRPTGYVADFAVKGIADAGQKALAEVSPAFTPDALYRRVTSGLEMAARFGITTVVEPQNAIDDLKVFQRVRDEGRLTSRVETALFHPVGTSADTLDAFDAARHEYDDDWLRVQAIKLYIDDIVEPHTAAMHEPYANRPDTRGYTYYDPEELAQVITELDRRGFPCFVHATGDRGITTTLDAFAAARASNASLDAASGAGRRARPPRHQVVHVECTAESDLDRFAELGVVACMQPRHCAPEIIEQWRENVGQQRWRYAWPMRSLAERGAVLAFSSDWNVAEMDPLVGIYTALTRADLDGVESWVPEECVDIETALHAYTWGSAYSIGAEGHRGTIEEGKAGDLTVFADDLFELAASGDYAGVLGSKVDLTVVGGSVTHRAADL